jgi:predicted transcriptional regulator
LSGFIRLLIQLREAFDDDIDLMIVLAAIGERTRPESWQPEPITYRQITRRKGEEYLQMPINMQSVSDFTGIPRETVRRKIQFLEKKGWVKRDADGRLTISGTAAVELEKSTIHSIEYLAAISNAVLEVNRREASISSI